MHASGLNSSQQGIFRLTQCRPEYLFSIQDIRDNGFLILICNIINLHSQDLLQFVASSHDPTRLRSTGRSSRNPNTARPQLQHGVVRRSQIRHEHVTKWNIQADQQHSSRPLTAAEIAAHPEYPHVYWDLKPTKKDSIDVAKGRGGPLKLAYEVHGHGPRKIVVCGLDVLLLGSRRGFMAYLGWLAN
jgi:hypothetical protein